MTGGKPVIAFGVEIVGVQAVSEDRTVTKPLAAQSQQNPESLKKSISQSLVKTMDSTTSMDKFQEIFLKSVDRQLASMQRTATKVYDDFPAGLQR
jgi:hypothetical protein